MAITITAPMAAGVELQSAMVLMRRGGEFDTPNGEMTDAVARAIAAQWQSPGSVGSVLAALASGRPVDRDELADDIAATARPEGWPVELEYLATWAANYDGAAVSVYSVHMNAGGCAGYARDYVACGSFGEAAELFREFVDGVGAREAWADIYTFDARDTADMAHGDYPLARLQLDDRGEIVEDVI